MLKLLEDMIKVLKLATKPTLEEYKLSLRVVIVGFSILGVIGFFFQLIGSMLEMQSLRTLPPEASLLVGLVALLAILALGLYLRSRSEV